MRNPLHSCLIGVAPLRTELKILLHDRRGMGSVKAVILRHIGLHQAQFHIRHMRRRRHGQSQYAKSRNSRQHENRHQRSRNFLSPAPSGKQTNRRCKNGNGQKIKAMTTDHRGNLRRLQRSSQGHTETVPRKPGQNSRPQPFGNAQSERKRQNTSPARIP